MQDTEQTIIEFLEDESATGMILCNEGQPIGYMSGTHLSDTNSGDILEEFQEIREIEDVTFYIESIAVLEEHRSTLTLDFLIHEMGAWVKDNEYQYATAHIRKRNGLSRFVQRRYKARRIKTYQNWMDFDEPFDYLLFDFRSVPTLPFLADQIIQVARRVRALLKGNPWLERSGGTMKLQWTETTTGTTLAALRTSPASKWTFIAP